MPDRTDLDALLIGALYGELTPADEARLTAHLESHPADRTALADLTRTRAAVHDSRFLAVQLEPPQAISALLLQEASRRAPRPEARDRETASWFQRFTRSFMAHPAMAAAAMLVLVLGVAGTLYVRGVDQFAASKPAEPPVLPAAPESQSEAAAVSPPSVAAAPSPEVAVNGGAATADDRIAAGAPASAGSAVVAGGPLPPREDAAGEPQEVAKQAPAKKANAPSAVPVEKAKASVKAGRKSVDRDADEVLAVELAKRAVAPVPEDKPAKSDKKLAGMVVQAPELAPQELEDSDEERSERTQRQIGNLRGDDAVAMANERARGRGAGAAPAGGGAAPVPPGSASAAPAPARPAPARPTPAPAAPRASAPVPAPAPAAVAALEPAPVADDASYGARNEVKKPSAKPAAISRPHGAPATASPPPPPAAVDSPSPVRDQRRFAERADGPGAKDGKAVAQKSAGDRALLEWARKQHGQVIALVSSNNCLAAASAAIEIYTRMPDYYAANVVTDRSIKPCLPYLNSRREREDRIRAAAKGAASADTPPTAPPPARK